LCGLEELREGGVGRSVALVARDLLVEALTPGLLGQALGAVRERRPVAQVAVREEIVDQPEQPGVNAGVERVVFGD